MEGTQKTDSRDTESWSASKSATKSANETGSSNRRIESSNFHWPILEEVRNKFCVSDECFKLLSFTRYVELF